jgi:hypothetical protein
MSKSKGNRSTAICEDHVAELNSLRTRGIGKKTNFTSISYTTFSGQARAP